MAQARLHLAQQLVDRLALRYEHRLAHGVLDLELAAALGPLLAHQVLEVHHADHVVGVLPDHGDA